MIERCELKVGDKVVIEEDEEESTKAIDFFKVWECVEVNGEVVSLRHYLTGLTSCVPLEKVHVVERRAK